MKKKKFIISIFLIIVVFITITNLPPILGMTKEAWLVLGLLLIMIILWLTEFIPLGITALLPIIYAPLFQITSLQNITANYSNPVIFLFLGGFILGIALEKWNLHIRLAFIILSKVGNNAKKQLLAFIAITAFMSMWISNTATVVILLPIALAVVGGANNNFSKALLLAIAYGASIGGISTLIGTPPNVFLKGFVAEHYGINIAFSHWLLLTLPLMTMLLIALYIILIKTFQIDYKSNSNNYNFAFELKKLGKMQLGEKLVGLIFISTASSWFFRNNINELFNTNLTDEIIAIIAVLALFITPVNLKEKKFLMDLEHLKKVPWDILLLFGGGLALSQLFMLSHLNDFIAHNLSFMATLSVLSILFIMILLMKILTELTSTTAIIATFLPIIAALAVQFKIDLLLLAIPLTIGASCSFMLPVSTPPNAIVFGSNKLEITDMLKTGFYLSIISVIIIPIYCYYMIPLIFK